MTQRQVPLGWGRYGDVLVSPTQLAAIRQGVGDNLSIRSIQDALRKQGIGIRRQAITDYRTELTGGFAKVPAIRAIRGDFRPTRRTMVLTGIAQKTRYRQYGVVRLFDPATGQRQELNVNYGFDELPTVDELKQGLEERALKYAQSYEWEIEDTQLNPTLATEFPP